VSALHLVRGLVKIALFRKSLDCIFRLPAALCCHIVSGTSHDIPSSAIATHVSAGSWVCVKKCRRDFRTLAFENMCP
jgi:hypothetical protein